MASNNIVKHEKENPDAKRRSPLLESINVTLIYFLKAETMGPMTFFKKTKITLDLEKSCRNSTESSHMLFTSFSYMLFTSFS